MTGDGDVKMKVNPLNNQKQRTMGGDDTVKPVLTILDNEWDYQTTPIAVKGNLAQGVTLWELAEEILAEKKHEVDLYDFFCFMKLINPHIETITYDELKQLKDLKAYISETNDETKYNTQLREEKKKEIEDIEKTLNSSIYVIDTDYYIEPPEEFTSRPPPQDYRANTDIKQTFPNKPEWSTRGGIREFENSQYEKNEEAFLKLLKMKENNWFNNFTAAATFVKSYVLDDKEMDAFKKYMDEKTAGPASPAAAEKTEDAEEAAAAGSNGESSEEEAAGAPATPVERQKKLAGVVFPWETREKFLKKLKKMKDAKQAIEELVAYRRAQRGEKIKYKDTECSNDVDGQKFIKTASAMDLTKYIKFCFEEPISYRQWGYLETAAFNLAYTHDSCEECAAILRTILPKTSGNDAAAPAASVKEKPNRVQILASSILEEWVEESVIDRAVNQISDKVLKREMRKGNTKINTEQTDEAAADADNGSVQIKKLFTDSGDEDTDGAEKAREYLAGEFADYLNGQKLKFKTAKTLVAHSAGISYEEAKQKSNIRGKIGFVKLKQMYDYLRDVNNGAASTSADEEEKQEAAEADTLDDRIKLFPGLNLRF